VLSDTVIEFDTPNFDKFGPVTVEGRVGVGGRSLTNSTFNFGYFAVTSCETSLVFGPSIISGCVAKYDSTMVIQAKDAFGLDRVCGMDIFSISANLVITKKDKELLEPVEDMSYNIVDKEDGTYTVANVYPAGGVYEVSVVFNGTFSGKAGHLRGSPFRVKVEDTGDRMNNELNGPMVMTMIRNQTKEVKDYSTNSLKNLKKSIPKEELDSLIKVINCIFHIFFS
jgi:dynein heavy chain